MFLDRKSPAYMGTCTRFVLNESLRKHFLALSDAVRYGGATDRMAVEAESPVWVDFARSMAPMMMMASQELAKLVIANETRLLKVLDIAAGHGLFGIAVLRANPNARVTAVDWKNVLEVARENSEKFGVADRYGPCKAKTRCYNFGMEKLNAIVKQLQEERNRIDAAL